MFDRFRSLSSRRQIILIVASAGVIGAALIAIWLVFLHTPYEPLFTNLRAADAATIMADLERKKIPYRLAGGGTTILVPAASVDATRLSVATEDLPLKGTVGFELFNKSDLGLTDFTEKINYQRALQGELARTIMSLDGVEWARVHLSLGEGRIFREDRVAPKASVTLRMKAGAVLPQISARGIQRLIAAAVPQLEPTNVVILDERGALVGAGAQSEMQGQTVSSANKDMVLSPTVLMEAGAQESARNVVTIDSHPDADNITLGVTAKSLPEPSADHGIPRTRALAQSGAAVLPPFADAPDSLRIEFAIAALLLLALLGLFIVMLDAQPRRRRLSARQRAGLVIKLRKHLEERATRAAA